MRLWTLLVAALLAARAFAQPAPLSGFSDEGTFFLYLNEERAGRLTFQWKPDGNFGSTFILSMGGQSTSSSAALAPDGEGRWIKAVFENARGKTVFQRNGKDLTITFPDKTGAGTLPDNLLLFDDASPALISQALLRYDAPKGGKQTFTVLVLSAANGGPLTVERKETMARATGGRSLKLTHWIYALSGVELHVLAGQDSRVYLVSGLPWFASAGFSEQHALYVREGYEDLLPAPADDPLVSQPKYQVKVESGVKVPLRDGLKLSTDVYLPIGAPKAPVILMRTPYKKEMADLQARFYARRGYAFAVQDVRGRFASDGQWEALVNEPKDGYDAIEWLARQPWSSGKVGMIGESYVGWVQWLAASQHPPHLATIIPNVSPPDPFHNLPYDHGVVALMPSMPWFAIVESNATGDLSGVTKAMIDGKNFPELLKTLPVIDLDKAILGRESLSWRRWLAHPTADRYWKPVMFADKLKGVHIPVFHQSAWFDGDGIGSKLNYLAMAGSGHSVQKLTVGPWGHSGTAVRSFGERDFGSSAVIDLQRDYLRWFDYWLKGIDNGILKEPLVSLFVMGSNRWLHGPKYPLPETRFEKLYLASGGHANTSKGDGRLSFTRPEGNQVEDRYLYDPGDPTPEPGMGGPAEREQVTAARKDILVYSTPPFEKPYTIAGPVSAVLYASTSARDTDWIVHLVDVDPDGKCYVLWSNGSGQLRARYRNSMAKPELLDPGRIYKYTIDLCHTGVTIAPGHRLRVEVASAAFPMFSRNLNTGGNNETETRFVTASQAIYHDARRQSHILLPMIPEK